MWSGQRRASLQAVAWEFLRCVNLLPNQLWIGNAGDGRETARLLHNGIVAVINLAAEVPSPNVSPRSMVYCHFPLVDGPQDDPTILRVAIQTVATLLKSQVPTLVYCGAGMSRSPAVVAAALAIVQGGSPEEKVTEVVAGHPHDVSPQVGRRSLLAVTLIPTINQEK